jgi:hypothetical protein
LWKIAWMVFADMSWAWVSFLTLLPVVIHFRGDIRDGNLCGEISLICRCHHFSNFTSW